MSGGLQIIFGVVLLTLGRKLFWLFVAGVGFAVGMFITPLVAPDAPGWASQWQSRWLCSARAGDHLAENRYRLVGFIAGGLIALWLLKALALDLGAMQWLIFIVGGIAARCS